MRRLSILLVILSSACDGPPRAESQARPVDGEWRAYGRDPLGSRWSPLAEITRENVSRLAPAWTYHTGETAPEFATRRRQRSLEVTPLVVGNRMYVSTP